MPLTYHYVVDPYSTFGTDSKETTKSKLNSNFGVSEDNEQAVEDRMEDVNYDSQGSGVLNGMGATLPGGLSITVASGTALIGYAIQFAGGSVTCESSQDPGYIFFSPDGSFHVDDDNTPPSGKNSFLYAIYTSDGYDVLTVTLQKGNDGVTNEARAIPLDLIVLSDTVSSIDVSETYDVEDYEVDHESLGEFVIPGFITLELSDNTAFKIEHLYMGGITRDSDFAGSSPDEDTPTTFWVRITRQDGYTYAYYPSVDLTWTRRGFGFAV